MSSRDLIRAVLRGEDRPGRPLRLATSEDGMLSLVAIVTVMFFLILAMLVGNVMMIVNRKIEVQNTADAVAISAGTQLARGMNAVTAMNHLMGELLAIVVLHDALAGDRPNEVEEMDDDSLNKTIETLAKLVDGPIADEQVKKRVKAEAAVLDGKVALKNWLIKVYIARAICKLLKNVPIIGPVFAAIDLALLAVEGYILAEWMAIEGFEIAAKTTEPAVRPLFNVGLPAGVALSVAASLEASKVAVETAEGIAKLNGMSGALYPEKPLLPLVPDSASASSDDEVKKTQLTRASWPFVAYHRTQIFDITGWMVFSQFRKHYNKHTKAYMLKKSRETYERNARPLVLVEMQPEQKGREPWTTAQPQAEKLFTVVGFSHRPAPKPAGIAVFRQANPAGLAGFAQALLYNANGNNPDSGPGALQPAVGWDTLNWKPSQFDPTPIANQEAFEFSGPDPSRRFPCPLPHPNWQVKLVPATRVGEAKDAVKEPFRKALRVIDGGSSLSRTH